MRRELEDTSPLERATRTAGPRTENPLAPQVPWTFKATAKPRWSNEGSGGDAE